MAPLLLRSALAVLGASVGLGVAVAAATPVLQRRYLRVAVAGESMTPALQPGEFLVLRRGAPSEGDGGNGAGAYGHVVAVYDPRPEMRLQAPRLLLKRIVGLPGESLRIGGGVQINGRVLEEPYAHGETPFEQHRGINRLGTDEYFLVGDHRGASTDSRDFGPVRREDIVGTVVLRYWPPRRFGRVTPPERRLLGVADRPGPGAQPLPWLGQREASGPSEGLDAPVTGEGVREPGEGNP